MSFKNTSPKTFHGLVLIYDIIGFTRFYNQPDVYNFATKYLNIIEGYINDILNYKKLPWARTAPKNLGSRKPVHRKFMGDGELMIFNTALSPGWDSDFIKGFISDLWSLMNNIDTVNKMARDQIPVAELPAGVRFSMTRGTILELTPEQKGAPQEYIGVPLNLASRLQSHSRSIRFITSAKIGPSKIRKDPKEFKRLVIKDLKGFPPELVYIDTASYDRLSKKDRQELFRDVK